MIRRIKFSVLLLVLFLTSFSNLFSSVIESRKYLTYLDLSFVQNINLMDGYSYGGGFMNSSFGILYDFNEKNSLVLNYNLLYNGPSVNLNSRDLMERIINNSLSVEWQKKINDSYRVRTDLYTGKEMRKSSSIGDFNDNLYNNNSKGVSFYLDRYFSKRDILTSGLIYRKIEFPNYTDLITEFKIPGSQSNISGGLYDNNLYVIDLKLKKDGYFASMNYTIQKYINQKIVLSSGTYSSEKQNDKNIKFIFGLERTLNNFLFFPTISFIHHDSNQNFLRFKSLTDLSPYFVRDAYDYNQYSFKIPSSFSFLSMDFELSMGYDIKSYVSRPPRDINNDYILSRKQKDYVLSLDFSVSRKINDIASISFYYSFVKSDSNNKFDAYLPLNYTANSFGFGYRIRY